MAAPPAPQKGPRLDPAQVLDDASQAARNRSNPEESARQGEASRKLNDLQDRNDGLTRP